MPELPEVETISRDLNKRLQKKRISQVKILSPKIVSPAGDKFIGILKGVGVKNISRRGKLIIFDLSDNHCLHIHMKMTGQLVLREKNKIVFGGHPITGVKTLPNKYTHLIITFTNGDILYFNDLRRFGYAKLLSKNESDKIIESYGVEPLSKKFSTDQFDDLLKRRPNAMIKAALMDQGFIAGVGNIYADEACFGANIRPGRRIKSLSKKDRHRLWRALRQVLILSIKHKGTTFNTYVDSNGEAGSFSRYLKVYGRGGKPCKRCGIILKKTRIGGRGTVFCPACQK